jgi:multiple sugar transport system permease protein
MAQVREATQRSEADRPSFRPSWGSGSSRSAREARFAYALLAPGVLIVLALVLLPVLWNVTLSFREIRLIELRDFSPLALDWVLANYALVVGAADFLELLRTTFLYAVLGTTLALLLGLWAALILRRPFRGRSLVRGLVLFPYVVPVVAAALLWRTMLNPQLGIVNVWLDALLGTGRINFLTQRSFEFDLLGMQVTLPAAFTMVVLFEAWRSFPFAFLFILARLQAIPADMEEAAQIDGASKVQSFVYVILPQLKAVFAVLFLLRFIWTFNAFDEIFLLTGGAAGTTVISVQIFGYLFGRSDVGAAAALSVLLALLLGAFLFIYFRWFYTEEEA